MKNNILQLKPGREKALKRENFWIFSGAVAKEPQLPAGSVVEVHSAKGEFLAHCSYSPKSQIRARAWSFCQDEAIDVEFFRRRLRSAYRCRELSGITNSCSGFRLVAAEGDALPAVVIDQYNDTLVMQLLSAGSDFMRDQIAQAIKLEFPHIANLYERSDVGVRRKEGLGERTGVIFGEKPSPEIVINEHNMKLIVDICKGHKTGFYFDQRANRKLVGEWSKGRKVLNLFSYTGGFGVAAALNGATSIENVDSSANSLELARRNMLLNNIDSNKFTNTTANVFELLRAYEKSGQKFDLIVLDPPKLVESQANLTKGARAYKELALRAFNLLEPNGLLFTFSCSGLVNADLFAKITFDASFDAGCSAVILQRLSQDIDHPVWLSHPESSYLKGMLLMKR